jgi:uncharacterized membrane protein YgcG
MAVRALGLLGLSCLAALSLATAARAAAPANDEFGAATALPATLPGGVSGSNLEATKELGEPNHAGNLGGHSVWYSWTPSASGPVGITGSCFSAISPLVAVYTGSSVSALTPVASNESAFTPVCPFTESPVAEFSAAAGTTYWIAVDGRDGTQGSFELLFSGPPANDAFATPTVIAPEPPEWTSGTLRLASKEAGEPDHAGDLGGHSVWYSWTPSNSGPVDISTCTAYASLDTVLAVYTGSTLGGLTQVAANDDSAAPIRFPECGGGNSQVSIDAVAGTTYRIAVDGAGGVVGRFNLRFRGRPPNDDFANARVLSGAQAGTQATTRLATKQVGEPDHAGDPGGHSVWYSWTPSSSGPVTIYTCQTAESELDTLLAVYTGSAVDDLTPVASNDDGAPGCRSTDSGVRFDAVANTTYSIAVDGKDGGEGWFDIQLEMAPANDAFATPQALPASLPISTSGSTRSASREPGEPSHAGSADGGSVWFSWTPAASGPVAISTCPYTGETPDTVLAVYTGSTLAGLTPLAANDDSPAACSATGSELELDVSAGTTYSIAVAGKADSSGIFSLDIEGRPANDDFATAEVLPAEPMTAGGSTSFASKEPGEPDHAGEPGGHSLWYSWTPTSSAPVDISACGHSPAVDTLLAVYTGSAVNALTPVASNDDGSGPRPNGLCEPGTNFSDVVIDVSAGTTYRIAVDTKESTGRFGLSFERGQPNDAFAAPQQLGPGLPASAGGSDKLAGVEPGEPNHAGEPGGHSLWYSWTPTSSGPVELSTCTNAGNLDTLLAAYTGSALNSLTPVAASDDDPGGGCRATDSDVEFAAVAGTTYRIAVAGKAGSWGSFQLSLEGSPGNDDFAKAIPVGANLPIWWTGSNRFASKESGEPDHAGDPGGHSLWFKWTAPRSGTVSVDTCGSSFDTLLAVYTGSALNALTPVASSDDGSGKCSPGSRVSFPATANTVYRIAVDGKAGAQGHVELRLSEPPANDAFADADPVFASGGYWPGTTDLAGMETGEPDHGGGLTGHSVWYSWAPVRSGTAAIEACASSFEPLLDVYTGAAVDALSPVPTADAGAGECAGGRQVTFAATAGTTYRVAVDAPAGESGHFELHFGPPAVRPRLLSVNKGGDGSGSVSSPQAGIACGASCRQWFEAGATVSLVATPAPGSTFAGWSGGGCSGTGPCQVNVTANTGVTATFEVAGSGGGDGGGSGGGGGGGSDGSAGGGGSSGGGTAGGKPPAPRSPKPKCRAGFKAKTVHGKRRCVKKPKQPHRPKKSHHR